MKRNHLVIGLLGMGMIVGLAAFKAETPNRTEMSSAQEPSDCFYASRISVFSIESQNKIIVSDGYSKYLIKTKGQCFDPNHDDRVDITLKDGISRVCHGMHAEISTQSLNGHWNMKKVSVNGCVIDSIKGLGQDDTQSTGVTRRTNINVRSQRQG